MALRPGALRRGVMGTTGAQFARYSTIERIVREADKNTRREAKKMEASSMSAMQKQANDEYFREGGGPLFPGTFVPLPLSRYPGGTDFLRYSWYRLRQWGIETLSVLQFKLKSMPDWTTRPKWKAARGKIAPTAKAMYTEMLTAYAAGDKTALHSLCLGQFAKGLTVAIDRRNPNERISFEVVGFKKSLFYPRVVAHQVHAVNPYDKHNSTEQAVVAIASTQRASKYKKRTGELIPGSTKVQKKIEYVALSRQIDERTFRSGRWRIWGTVSATTIESYLEEQAWINLEQAQRAGWTGPSKK
ncbi:hypothetical protein N0V84_011861 [Fusarium piperis]|uniref:Large ribosomal subunit protein mL45 n=1 Tax=Fusarium piperis TaxID=1435070 RepID=A0A9W8TCJ4_9HYPO|nr:hypothetical protein N0V84_011861 [Fusarium piperis]